MADQTAPQGEQALDLEAIREKHFLDPVAEDDGYTICAECRLDFPCDTFRLVAEVERLRASAPAVVSPQPKARNEWRLDERGCLDDVVVDDPETFRLERMGDDHIWGAIYNRDGSRTVFNIFGERVSLDHEIDTPAREMHSAAVVSPGGEKEQLALLASMDEWLGNSEGIMIEDVIEWRNQLAHALGKSGWGWGE